MCAKVYDRILKKSVIGQKVFEIYASCGGRDVEKEKFVSLVSGSKFERVANRFDQVEPSRPCIYSHVRDCSLT